MLQRSLFESVLGWGCSLKIKDPIHEESSDHRGEPGPHGGCSRAGSKHDQQLELTKHAFDNAIDALEQHAKFNEHNAKFHRPEHWRLWWEGKLHAELLHLKLDRYDQREFLKRHDFDAVQG